MRNGLKRLLVILMMFTLAACTAKSSGSNNGPSSGSAGNDGKYEEVHYYYDFDDILIHKDLKYDIKDSTVLEADSFKVGFQVFTGRIEPLSLVNFFQENMAKDGWKNIYSLKGRSSELIFEKPGKRCTIKVVDEPFSSTRVEIQAVEIRGQGDTTRTTNRPGTPSGSGTGSSGSKTSGSASTGGVKDRTLSQ